MSKISIKNWAEDDRPREKLLANGAAVLSNAEILAILINNGTRDLSAIDVTKNLLNKVDNSLTRLSKMTVQEILQLKIKGIGQAKAVSIVAALELLNRKSKEEFDAKFINSSADAAAYLRPMLQNRQKEVFGVVFLNQANKIIHFEIISQGGITGTVVDPRIIFKNAFTHNATGIILTHNHPSGSLKPSEADKQLTDKIKSASSFMEIRLLDHIIISENGYYSFSDKGLI